MAPTVDGQEPVVVYIMFRTPHSPSVSPAAVKVEAFLRLAKIPHTAVVSAAPGPDGRWPWITHAGR
jgi:hypothetical protein